VQALTEDVSFNRRTSGIGDPKANGATVFEIDRELGQRQAGNTREVRAVMTTPVHDPAGSLNEPTISDPFFIELEWPGERNEYPGDSSNGVTITKAELDGIDVMEHAIPQSANSYRIGIQGITLGAHTLKYNAEDAVGNTYQSDKTLAFTVLEVPNWRLSLSPGMNLISVPSAPQVTDVNSVFGDTEEIDLIFTFEGGQSKVAIRDTTTSQFVGTLKSIDSQHAYWISATNTAHVDISIPPASQFASLPSIQVTAGQWTLIPVMSLGRVNDDTPGVGAAPNTLVDPDAYLGSYRTAFGWSGRSWTKFDPDAEGDATRNVNDLDEDDADATPLKIGMGYWVLYNESDIITP
jgi:hypothetical protein